MAPGFFGKMWDKVKSVAGKVGNVVGKVANKAADVMQYIPGVNKYADMVRSGGNAVSSLTSGNFKDAAKSGLQALAGVG